MPEDGLVYIPSDDRGDLKQVVTTKMRRATDRRTHSGKHYSSADNSGFLVWILNVAIWDQIVYHIAVHL